MTSLKGRSAASIERVKRAGIEVIDDDDLLVREADFIMSIVPPGVAVEVAAALSRCHRCAREAKPIFVECNAIAPATTRRIEEILRGVRFIDAGIIGGPPAAGTQDPAKGPRFYASGAERERTDAAGEVWPRHRGARWSGRRGLGAEARLCGDDQGFHRAGDRDGQCGLARGAGRCASRPSWRARNRGYLTRLERSIPDMFPKAYRWVAEMEQIAEFIGDEREGANIYDGMARLYEWIASELERGDSRDIAMLAELL